MKESSYLRVFSVVTTLSGIMLHRDFPNQSPKSLINRVSWTYASLKSITAFIKIQIEILYCFKSHKDILLKHSIAKRAMREMHLLAARQICSSFRSEYYGGEAMPEAAVAVL
jgi:hypothetical protein